MKKLLPFIMIAPMLVTACANKEVETEPVVTRIVSPLATAETLEAEQPMSPDIVVQQITIPTIATTAVEIVETELYVEFNRDAELIAKTLYGECRGIESDMEKAAVAWTILNRVDDPRFPNTVEEVVSQPYQFAGFSYDFPIWDNLLELSKDVLIRWYTDGDGRVLPKEYVFFHGDGKHNHFRVGYRDKEYWDWSLPNPYEGG